jgi:hypothetical protein
VFVIITLAPEQATPSPSAGENVSLYQPLSIAPVFGHH